MRHAGFTLQREGQERIGGPGSRPAIFIGAEKPDAIGGKSCRLFGPSDLNGGIS